ncbi:SNARE domain-containing protein [Sphingobacterium corticibacter]|uniref:Uncharacterized protein n=1 Tax=Sphingobacterium corticibacter TaxID=2171749 RepID=A0A2T8HLP6_9SPHI|nr:hypothetical protein [Sphingobacterium corticibacter]PVH26310.1 hypothetical protein DC487_01395 [Sphingobacterium corticibacter]
MELFYPENFYQTITLFGNFITICIAAVGLLIAFNTYMVAHEAKKIWMEEKTHDYEVTIGSNIEYLSHYLKKIYDYSLESRTRSFISGSNNFKYLPSRYAELSDAYLTIKEAIDYYNHIDYGLGNHRNDLDNIVKKIHPAVIGLKNSTLKNIFFDIKAYIREQDDYLDNIQTWVAFFKDIYDSTGNIESDHLKRFEAQCDFDNYFQYFNNKLINFENRIANFSSSYLRGDD